MIQLESNRTEVNGRRKHERDPATERVSWPSRLAGLALWGSD